LPLKRNTVQRQIMLDAIGSLANHPMAEDVYLYVVKNHALKINVHSGYHPRTKKDIRHKVESFMRCLQHHKENVSAFFLHNSVFYCLCAE